MTEAISADGGGVRRRDFINIAAVSFAGVGGVVAVLPLVNQMNPSADVLAMASTEVDISGIKPGQAIKTTYRSSHCFRTPDSRLKEIAKADALDVSPVCAIRRRLDQRTIDDGKEAMADHDGRLHPSGLRSAGRWRRRSEGRVRRLFLPLPRFALRHCRPHPQRSRRPRTLRCRRI
jgi:hypothetical protein